MDWHRHQAKGQTKSVSLVSPVSSPGEWNPLERAAHRFHQVRLIQLYLGIGRLLLNPSGPMTAAPLSRLRLPLSHQTTPRRFYPGAADKTSAAVRRAVDRYCARPVPSLPVDLCFRLQEIRRMRERSIQTIFPYKSLGCRSGAAQYLGEILRWPGNLCHRKLPRFVKRQEPLTDGSLSRPDLELL